MPTSPASERRPESRPAPYLEANDLSAGYDNTLILNSVSASVGQGEIACIVGPNGSGKSTFVKAVTGDLPVRKGTIRLGGTDVTSKRRDQLARLGVRLVPQENVVFDSLTVQENLAMGGFLLRRRDVPAAIERVLEAFPALRQLQKATAGRLSGGERKLVAIARALMSEPKVVVLDEPSASVAPAVSTTLLAEQVPALAAAGVAVLLIEQRAVQALECSDWGYVMVAGRIEISMPASEVLARGDIGELFLGRRVTGEGSTWLAKSGQ